MSHERHLASLRASGHVDERLLSAVSLIGEDGGRKVRMGNLAFLGSHKVNGVSALHTELMRQTVFRAFHHIYPDRIVNKTNGITFRRWLFEANPGLTQVLTDVVGPRLLDDVEAIKSFGVHADDTSLHQRLAEVRRGSKVFLSNLIAE